MLEVSHYEKTLAITEFKAHALQILADVAKTKEPVVVTKRGKALA
ncbi:MAG: type II toxin-antitoxin system Phd/YefM family antitoxin [Lentisphaerae bacterium]|nr:type II toxin-antitoxin system Phd/YefM family antitoxin [Lentisphaerota bacterium]